MSNVRTQKEIEPMTPHQVERLNTLVCPKSYVSSMHESDRACVRAILDEVGRLQAEVGRLTAENERLRAALADVQKMAEDDITHARLDNGSFIYQIEADARKALDTHREANGS